MDQKSKYPYDLSGMFTDRRFRRCGRYRYVGEIDGKKIGVVLATKSPSYFDYALNKPDLDRVIAGKRAGRLDEAIVVKAKIGVGIPQYHDQIDAEQQATELVNVMPRSGAYGEFFVLPDLAGEDEAFDNIGLFGGQNGLFGPLPRPSPNNPNPKFYSDLSRFSGSGE
jgi:hypothetical protein